MARSMTRVTNLAYRNAQILNPTTKHTQQRKQPMAQINLLQTHPCEYGNPPPRRTKHILRVPVFSKVIVKPGAYKTPTNHKHRKIKHSKYSPRKVQEPPRHIKHKPHEPMNTSNKHLLEVLVFCESEPHRNAEYNAPKSNRRCRDTP